MSSPNTRPALRFASTDFPMPVGPTKNKVPLGLPALAVTSDMLTPTLADSSMDHGHWTATAWPMTRHSGWDLAA